EFLDEIKNNLSLNFAAYCNVIYGVTRDPHDNKYAIVMKFQNLGNLRESIKKDHILNWRRIVNILHNISYGLSTIHRENYCHGDFQTSNILLESYGNYLGPVISDFGLCRPADQSSIDKTLYGVLPFVAPEVLRGIEFTKASDVYGFGMVMLEIICGNVPFADRDYDIHLALDTCKGERPPIPEYTPKPYAALMKRCWDPIPTKRPTAQELYRQIGDWDTILSKFELNDKQIAIKLEIEKEFSQEREDMWKEARLTINPHPLKHSQNSLTSKRLEYSQQLNQLLDKNDTTYYTTRQFDMSLCHPKLKTKEEFSQEPEDRWKIRLSKLITNSYPLKYSQNFLTSKRLEDSKKLHQLNDTTYYTRQFDMSLCLPKVLDNYV
ncbi:kinase-like protein, partial [Rhizophagus irregularis]